MHSISELNEKLSAVQHWTVNDGSREITEEDVVALREMDDLDAADIYDARARAIERIAKRTFAELGLICMEMTERKLWAKIVDPETGVYFHSIDAWIASALNVSRSTAYRAMGALRNLTEVAVADVKQMSSANAVQLSQLSSAVQRDPEMVEAAKSKSEREFVVEVQKKYPEQHIEPRKRMVLATAESVRHAIDEAVQVAMWVYDVESREAALEAIAEFFMSSSCEREACGGRDNRMAYAMAIGRDGKAHV